MEEETNLEIMNNYLSQYQAYYKELHETVKPEFLHEIEAVEVKRVGDKIHIGCCEYDICDRTTQYIILQEDIIRDEWKKLRVEKKIIGYD